MSTVDNTCDYARVSHSRQWSNYNILYFRMVDPFLQNMYSVWVNW